MAVISCDTNLIQNSLRKLIGFAYGSGVEPICVSFAGHTQPITAA